jgi:hypothetical protein
VHSGDCRPGITTSSGGRNDETIIIDIARLPPQQHSVALCVVSCTGQPLAAANGAKVTVTAHPPHPFDILSAAAASPSKRRPVTPSSVGSLKVAADRLHAQGRVVGVFSLTAGDLTFVEHCRI